MKHVKFLSIAITFIHSTCIASEGRCLPSNNPPCITIGGRTSRSGNVTNSGSSYPSGSGRNSGESSSSRRNGNSGNVTNSNDCSQITRDRNFYCERFRNNKLNFIAEILQSQEDFILCMDYSRQAKECEQEIKDKCMLTNKKEITAKIIAIISTEVYVDYQILSQQSDKFR